MADALGQVALDVVVNHLRQAPELLLDGLRLPDQHIEHPIFGPLGKHEVMASHFRRGLQLAIDAPVALLDAAWIPRQVEMEQIRTIGLEVQALAGGIGGEQNA